MNNRLITSTLIFSLLVGYASSSKLKESVEHFLPLVLSRITTKCSKQCHEENCDTMTIKYGKFCGIRHSGCRGEEPCDDVDACCKAHDDCTAISGYLHSACHSHLVTCIQQFRGKTGFSKTCSYDTVIPTLERNMIVGLTAAHIWNMI